MSLPVERLRKVPAPSLGYAAMLLDSSSKFRIVVNHCGVLDVLRQSISELAPVWPVQSIRILSHGNDLAHNVCVSVLTTAITLRHPIANVNVHLNT